MDTRIAVLPEAVIDQIAAGEVIERPASVVKELVDNAIDAGARTIGVEAQAGGRFVRVVDDGGGMSPREAVLAFERHATSKLRALDDLWGIATMGFRGEALPAIASVARVTLTTRREGDLAGTRVQIEGGRLVAVTEVGAPAGTTVEVADLLYNVPARLKFLKGEATEASHITDLVAKVALAYPALHVRLRHNGRVALDAPPDRDGFARVQALLGARIANRMVPVTGEETGVRVVAYLGAPELAQSTARGVQMFVGRRAVRDRGLLHAIAMGYGELVPRGRYPTAIVMIDVPAGAVDVNVHPQKLEVRFSDAAAVCAAVRHVVQAGIARAPWRDEVSPVMMTAIASVAPPKLPLDAPATALAHTYSAERSQARLGFGDARQWSLAIKERVRSARAAEAGVLARAAYAVRDATPWEEPELARGSAPVASGGLGSPAEASSVPASGGLGSPAEASSVRASRPAFFASLRYLGQLDLTYLVCEADGELVLIEQHIAHERVELARLKAGHGEYNVPTQRLLFPTTIDVKPELLEVAGKMTDVLAQVGYEAESFGKSALAVKSVPGGLRHADPTQLLRRLLGQWAEAGAPSEAERLDQVLAEIACHSVVRAGDRLSASEAEALLRSMDGADFAARGPHGRPVMLRMPIADIARRFGRS